MANAWIVRPLPMASIDASNVAAGHSGAALGNDYMGVVWKTLANSTYQQIIVDLGADVPADTVMLLGCTAAKAAWTMNLFAATQAQGPSFATYVYQVSGLPFLAGAAMPASGRGRMLHGAPSTVTARYWMVQIEVGAPQDAVISARIVIGKRLQLARNFQFGAAFGVRELGGFDVSRRGVPLWTRGAKRRSVGLTFGSVHKDEVESAVHPLIETVGGERPIALITDSAVHAERQNRIWFGPLIGDLGTVWAAANRFEWRAQVQDLGG